jgi:predicted nucleic acid-binding protein
LTRTVLSEATKPSPDPTTVEWLRLHKREIAVDPVVLGELRFGILLLAKGKRRARLEQWLEKGARRLSRIPWDATTGPRWPDRRDRTAPRSDHRDPQPS